MNELGLGSPEDCGFVWRGPHQTNKSEQAIGSASLKRFATVYINIVVLVVVAFVVAMDVYIHLYIYIYIYIYVYIYIYGGF